MLFYVRDRGPVKNSVATIQQQNPGANTFGSRNNHQPTTPLDRANVLFRPTDITKVNPNLNAPSSQIQVFKNGKPLPVQKSSDLQSNSNSDPATSKDTATKDPIQVPSTEPSVVTTMMGNSSVKVSEVLDEQPQKKPGIFFMHVVESQKVIGEGCSITNVLHALAQHEHQGDAGSINASSKPDSLEIASNADATSTKPELLGAGSNGVHASAKPEFKEITSNVSTINQKDLLELSIVPKVTFSLFFFPLRLHCPIFVHA
jgi:hypothetical protein